MQNSDRRLGQKYYHRPIIMTKIRIFILDDHELVRTSLRNLLEFEHDMEVCGSAETFDQGLTGIRFFEPDIVLADISLRSKENGIDLLKIINQEYPALISIALSMHEEKSIQERALAAGAKKYLVKHESTDKLVGVIRELYAQNAPSVDLL